MGDGTTTDSLTPVQTGGLSDAFLVSAGALQSLAVNMPPDPIVVTALTLDQLVVYGPGTVTGTVTLSGPAPAGGVEVTVVEDSDSAHSFGTAFVPEGSTTGPVLIMTAPVGVPQHRVNVTASFGGVSITRDFYINQPFVTSVTIDPGVVPGGTTTTGTVTINNDAPKGGMLISLSSSNGVASVPATVLVPEKAKAATFDIETSVVASGQSSALITATGGGASKTRAVYVNQPYLQSVSFGPSIVYGGNPTTGAVQLTGPAPAGGLVVSLESDHANVGVPATATIPEGATFGLFPVTTVTGVDPQIKAIVTATLGPVVKRATVYVNRPYIQSLSLSPSIVYGGTSSTATVTLNSAAPAGGLTITLSDNSGNASTPATVTVLEGETSATFEVTTSPHLGAQLSVVVSATAESVTKNAALYINQPFVTGVSFSPEVIVGGNSTTGTVTLNAPAPPSGFLVTLESDNGSATVPVSVLVPAGETSVTFTVDSTAVVGPQVRALISATGGGATMRKYVYLNSAGLMALREPNPTGAALSPLWMVALAGPLGLHADLRRRPSL